MKDEVIQSRLSWLMLGGVLGSGAIILAGLVWFLLAHIGVSPGDHLFSGEPKYLETIGSMLRRAFTPEEAGRRRSLIMVGIVLLLLNPVFRVGFAAVGFWMQRDRLYAGISAFVLLVLLFSFFW
jgi:uncharacterized membrane protein